MKSELRVMYNICIGGVDGETNAMLTTRSINSVYDFLSKHDHEGSSISLNIQTYDEDVYKTLESLNR